MKLDKDYYKNDKSTTEEKDSNQQHEQASNQKTNQQYQSWFLKNKWLIASILIVIISSAYWVSFVINAYNSYHTYWDVTLYAYSMFYHVNYPQYMGGLQYLVFADHIAPIQLLVLPIYALFQSALTLTIVQALVLCLTGLLVYFVANDLTKNGFVSFALCLAYLVNPGMHGIMLFDYHSEFFIIPLIILVFYAYMKNRKYLFLIFLVLFLAITELAPILSLSLGMGLFLYEYRYDKSIDNALKKERYKMIAILMVLSIIALGTYYGISTLLNSSYSNNAYPQLPPYLRAYPFSNYLSSKVVSAPNASALLIFPSLPYFSILFPIYAMIIVFLGFGITALFIPDITFVLALPWLGELFVLGNGTFVPIWYHYYSFVIGGMVVATILSILILKENQEKYSKILRVAPIAMIVISLLILFYSPEFSVSANVPSISGAYFFNNPYQSQINQLNYVVSQVPNNASVFTNSYISAHLTQRRYLDTFGVVTPNNTNNAIWFKPQYILVDLNSNLSQNVGSEVSSLNLYVDENNYTTFNKTQAITNGSALLVKLK